MGRLLEIAKAALRQQGVTHVVEPSPMAAHVPGPPGAFAQDAIATPMWTASAEALYSGALTGSVPAGWSRDGWIDSLRDRMARTDDPVVRRMLKRELDAILATDPTEAAH